MKRTSYLIPFFFSFLCWNTEASCVNFSKLYGLLNDLNPIASRSLSKTLPKYYDRIKLARPVALVEVSPRDGLQNERRTLSVGERLTFINLLEKSGLRSIEGGAFVSPKHVPQMDNSFEVAQHLSAEDSKTSYPFLVPNLKGLERAMKAGVHEVAIFTSPSTEFTQKNIGMSVQESLDIQREVAQKAIANGMRVRGYVSCVMGCPYTPDEPMDPHKVRIVAEELLGFGCYQISLGDTIGVGTPELTEKLLDTIVLKPGHNPNLFAAHFHDTNGLALSNLVVALSYELSTIDSSVGGLGACPYALGATGNVATERVLRLLGALDIETGIDEEKLVLARDYVFKALCKA